MILPDLSGQYNLISQFIGLHLPEPFAMKCAMATNALAFVIRKSKYAGGGLHVPIMEIMCLSWESSL